MNDYKIALGALLDANSKGDIQKQLDAIKDLSVVVSKATLSADVINDIKRQLTQNGIDLNLVFNNNNVNQITNQAQQVGQQIGRNISSGINSIQGKIDTGSYDAQISNLETKFKKLGLSEDEVAAKMKNVNSALASMKESGIGQQELIIREQQFNTELITTSNQLKVMTNEMGLFMSSTQQVNLTTRIQKWLDNNTAATRKARQELQSYLTELKSGQVTKIRGNEIKASFAQVDAQMRSIGKLGNSFFKTIGDGMKKFSYWTSSTYIVMKTIHSVRQAVSTVSELDTALVDLKKTTSMTSSQLNEFYYTANDVAKQMGVTTQEIISQAAAWSRLKFRSAIW